MKHMRTEPRTYPYRLIKAGWGIHITITANREFCDDMPANAHVIPDVPVGLTFSDQACGLPAEIREQLVEAVSAAAEEISASVHGQPVLIDVSAFVFPELDFQLEGVPVAMRRWIEDEFGLEPREIIASFDRPTNTYVFHWH